MEKMESVDAFITKYPKDIQVILQKIRAIVREVVPDVQEVIAYGIPTFKLNGKNLVHFSAFDSHIGFYPTPSGIEAFKEELAIYKSAKGSVQFPLNKTIPYALIKKMIIFRTEELTRKK
ncbi:MAG: DUF1801 domain-containing protein [Candidatus Moranbacteria bacterium]|nr:DUF1801 domain-containing protein [Candidatus Moranbacteria bacterium]MDD3965244.1 DUF1801 domain-containing protein [Candidatus Moranbacteria bacterium]